MSLIKCVECGKEISDKSDFCINCGCPTKESVVFSEKERINHGDKLFYQCPVCKKDFTDGTFKCDVCKYESLVRQGETQLHLRAEKNLSNTNFIKCPTCGSTKVGYLSTYARLLGVFSMGRSRYSWVTFECKRCGYMW